MSTAHTPGPWAYDAPWGRIFYNDDEGSAAFPSIAWIETDNTSTEQAAADAALIAAAPDLLHACQTALAFVLVCIREGQKDAAVAAGIPAPYGMETVLRATIAKAEGRS